MIYFKVDCDFRDHPKFVAAGAAGRDLWFWAMSYTRDHQLDGFVPRAAVLSTHMGRGGTRNDSVAAHLIAVGLWEAGEDGWHICRYAEKGNDTKATIAASQAKAAARKEAWKERKRSASKNGDGTRSERETNGSGTVPEGEREREREREGNDLPSEDILGRERPTKPQARKQACPESTVAAEAVATWAATWGISAEHQEFSGFLDHHRAKRSLFSDWAAAWRTWLRNAEKFAGGRANGTYRNGRVPLQQPGPDGPLWKSEVEF